jgi:sugar phosphate isomerase/epimerase
MKDVTVSYRFAICNEIFQKMPLAESCRTASDLGYQGFEIAPFTLGEDPAALSAEKRADVRQTIAGEGLEFVGLHWLLTAPKGLQVVTNNTAVREHSWDYVRRLVDLSADLATPGARRRPVIVFGSPKQRSSVAGQTPQEAVKHFKEGMAQMAPHAESCGVTLLVEALSPEQTDVICCLSEAAEVVKEIGSPAVQSMFDVHNAIDEFDSHEHLVESFYPYIKHVHVNELDGREPGRGDYNFFHLLRKLAELNYDGWVSVEAFDFTREPYDIAQLSITTLKAAQSAGLAIKTPIKII